MLHATLLTARCALCRAVVCFSPRVSGWLVALGCMAALLGSGGVSAQQIQPDDRVVLASGQTIVGMILAETDAQVLVVVDELRPGSSGERPAGEGWPRGAIHWIDRAEIRSVDRRALANEPAPMGRDEDATAIGVVRIGLGQLDVIGRHVTAEGVFLALRAIQSRARADGLDPAERVVVVFQFNSGGGMLAEVPWLVEIVDWAEREFAGVIGLVERAESAAALVALACDRLVFAPAGVLGAALAFEDGPDGARGLVGRPGADAIEIARQAAERGGRDGAIGEAMASRSGLSYDAGDGSFELGVGGTLRLARPGTVLALSSADAEQIGVSEGTVSDLMGLLRHAGIERPGALYAATPLDVLLRRAEAGQFLLDHAEMLADSIRASLLVLDGTEASAGERAIVLAEAWRELARLEALVESYPELDRHAAFEPGWLAARAERLAAFGARPER